MTTLSRPCRTTIHSSLLMKMDGQELSLSCDSRVILHFGTRERCVQGIAGAGAALFIDAVSSTTWDITSFRYGDPLGSFVSSSYAS
jgi:hypothetical protein